jgi:hypothetical protein
MNRAADDERPVVAGRCSGETKSNTQATHKPERRRSGRFTGAGSIATGKTALKFPPVPLSAMPWD